MKVLLLVLVTGMLVAGQPAIKLALSESLVETALNSFIKSSLSVIALNKSHYYSNCTLSNLVINNSFPLADYNVSLSNVIDLSFVDFQSFITFNYSYNDTEVYDHGYGNISVTNSSLNILAFVNASDGYLQINQQNYDNADLGNFSIQAFSIDQNQEVNATILQNLANSVNSLIPTIDLVIDGELYSKINNLNTILTGLPRYLPLPPLGTMVDMHVTNDPDSENGYLALSYNGEALSYPFRSSILPFNPPALPEMESGMSLQAQLSIYLIDALAKSAFYGLNYNLSSLPSTIPIKLTTDGLAFLLPNLKKIYGPGKPIILNLSPGPYTQEECLNITIAGTSLNISANFRIGIYVVDGNVTYYPLYIDHFIQTYLDLSIADFSGKFFIYNFNLTCLEFSNPELVNIPLFNKILGSLIITVLPIVNAILSNITFPNPSAGFITDVSVAIGTNSFILQAQV
jgi:hypothetical protein